MRPAVCASRRVATVSSMSMLPIVLALLVGVASGAEWNPRAWADQDTLDLRTKNPEEEPHWSPVWLVVLDDGQVYVRLGSRATRRIENNETKPIVAVKIAGQEFDRIVGTPAPDKAEQVAKAMADKYWSDVLVRLVDHPLTLRLAPE
jgi:hypothetical protein